jgi:hypothetical protein
VIQILLGFDNYRCRSVDFLPHRSRSASRDYQKKTVSAYSTIHNRSPSTTSAERMRDQSNGEALVQPEPPP